MDKLFYNLYKRFRDHKILGITLLLAYAIAMFFLASKIEFEEDITKLIPQNERSTEIQQVLKQVNFADKIIVNIIRDENGGVDDMVEYATRFIDSMTLTFQDYFKAIQGQVKDEDVLNTMDFIYKSLPIFLNDSDYETIQNKLHQDSIEAITSNNYKTLISPSGIIAKQNILRDPLGLSFMALKRQEDLSFGAEFSLYDGFLLSQDQNNILLFITPKYESSETDKNAVFTNQLYALKDQMNADFNGKVRSECFGSALIAVANAQQIKHDIQLTLSIAVSILMIILILFYKRISIPIFLFIPTILGALLAVGVLFLIRTKISAISLGIGSVLLGVTLDYALHILTHIRSNNDVKALYADIAKPILMSSLTTALAFLCLLFLKSQALQDLGIFAAISVLSASIFALILIPHVYRRSKVVKPKPTIIDRFANYQLNKKIWILILLFICLGISLFTYRNVQFNNDLNSLNFVPSDLISAQNQLDDLTNQFSKSVYVVAYGQTEQEALIANEAIYQSLDSLLLNDQIIEFSSIGSLVQSEISQKKKIAQWQSFWSTEKINRTKQQLISIGEDLGFKASSFDPFYNLLESNFEPLSVSDYNALSAIAIEDYITATDDLTTVTTLVKVRDDQLDSLVNKFESMEDIYVIDRKNLNETFLGALKNDFNSLVLYSSIVVLLLLVIYYKSISLTLVTAVPIALTWILTIGIMGWIGIEFNIFNIIISTFIFGLGIDYCIFVTNGLLHEYRFGVKALPTHKTSIVLSVMTTILGVGVLIFAKHPALYSIALVSIIGILSALLLSFSIQPLLFELFIGSKTKRPITLQLLLHSLLSFGYYGIGGFLLSILGVVLIAIIPISKKVKMYWFHVILSKFMKSVLYTNPFVKKRIINLNKSTFEKQAIIISNHTSFLDILSIGMLHPKIIFLVNDWVYNSPVFGKAVKLAGFYPVSSGIEDGLDYLQTKVDQGYTLMAFPEGTRSTTNKIKRFHKGAFYLAEQLNLDIIPVLIHGNSEILPKGSFIIKKGTITLKILDRITAKDNGYGESSRERTKAISAYFKQEFKVLRNELEHSNYFHSIVLEDFRYKGNFLYKMVRDDLKENAIDYKTIMNEVDENARIIHLSNDSGQLDFLLALDAPSRKIVTYIDNENHRAIAKHSYISNTHYKISFKNSIEELLMVETDVAIVNMEGISLNTLKRIAHAAKLIILLKECRHKYLKTFMELGYMVKYESETLIILKSNAS